MRITNNMLTNNFLNNMNRNLEALQKNSQQMTSGKAVSKPSDNPILIGQIMSMRNTIKTNDQYNSNINDAQAWVQTQDTAMDEAKKTLDRIRDLMISGSNGTVAEDDRLVMKDKMDSEVEHLVDVLNTNFDGRYVFAGKRTGDKPFELADDGKIKYIANEDGKNGDNISREIASGVTIELMTDGSKIMQSNKADEGDLGELLNKITTAMEDGKEEDIENLSDSFLADLDKHIDNVLGVRTQIGAIDNRLEAAEDRNKAEGLNLKEVLSNKEDVDVIEKYMESMMLSVAFQASLQAGAKILQPSLMDYIR